VQVQRSEAERVNAAGARREEARMIPMAGMPEGRTVHGSSPVRCHDSSWETAARE
jgi:hypothetical protein